MHKYISIHEKKKQVNILSLNNVENIGNIDVVGDMLESVRADYGNADDYYDIRFCLSPSIHTLVL